MDIYRIDSQKLIYHPGRVSDWLLGKDIFPIYIEIAPFGGCNHRCIFCALDYMGYKPVALETRILKSFIKDAAKCGVKSVMFAGEGEPLLYKDIVEIVRYTAGSKIDVALTTNGVRLLPQVSGGILPYLTWLRVSLDAASPKTYAKIHRTSPLDFERVLENIKSAVHIKKKNSLDCTLGVQFLLLKENYNEAVKLAGMLESIGVDYLVIKPYSQHPSSINRLKRYVDYPAWASLEKRLNQYNCRNFQVIFRKNTMLKINEPKPYPSCLGLPFWAYLAADGNLYACSAFLGNRRFIYGNIYKQPFIKIWKGKKRKQILQMMQGCWDIEKCREVCRLDEINRYLWELRNPPRHVNFI